MARTLPAIDLRIAQRLRDARKEAGLTLGQVADVLGTTASHLADCEAGRQRVSAGHLQMVADLLYLPVAVFFDPPATAGAERPSPAPATLAVRH